jgi:hypothetical protein
MLAQFQRRSITAASRSVLVESVTVVNRVAHSLCSPTPRWSPMGAEDHHFVFQLGIAAPQFLAITISAYLRCRTLGGAHGAETLGNSIAAGIHDASAIFKADRPRTLPKSVAPMLFAHLLGDPPGERARSRKHRERVSLPDLRVPTRNEHHFPAVCWSRRCMDNQRCGTAPVTRGLFIFYRFQRP